MFDSFGVIEYYLSEINRLTTRVKLPCTPPNQRFRIEESIADEIKWGLPGLKDQFFAELAMMTPNQKKADLLDQLIMEAKAELKRNHNWTTVRLGGIKTVADQLADSAAQLMKEDKGDNIEEEDLFIDEYGKSDWRQFFGLIEEDLFEYKQAFLLSSYIDWLLDQYRSEETVRLPQEQINRTKSFTQAQRALFYAYLHVTECAPDFSTHSKGKGAAIREMAAAEFISAKHFEQTYNRFLAFSNRTAKQSVPIIKSILPLLERYPEARGKALDELKIAQGKLD